MCFYHKREFESVDKECFKRKGEYKTLLVWLPASVNMKEARCGEDCTLLPTAQAPLVRCRTTWLPLLEKRNAATFWQEYFLGAFRGRNKSLLASYSWDSHGRKKGVLNNDVHSNSRFVSFRQVSSLSPNFFTFKNGGYTTDLMGLLPALNENKST